MVQTNPIVSARAIKLVNTSTSLASLNLTENSLVTEIECNGKQNLYSLANAVNQLILYIHWLNNQYKN